MRPAIVIPTYWAGNHADTLSPGAYDHSTDLHAPDPELDRCLASLEKVRNVPRIILLIVCPLSATRDVLHRIDEIVERHPALDIVTLSNREASRIMDRVGTIAPYASGEAISLRGYGAIRNMGLAAAAILGHDVVIFLDDDEVVISTDFMARALYGLGQETRQRLPIIAKSGYYYDSKGSPLADEAKAGITQRWWTKRIEFNKWMRRALAGTRISRSNYVCGGCFALHARAFTRIAFDPFITRGEDLDYLFNMRLFGFDVWFDNTWAVKHLPPERTEEHTRFMQNVYRWYYERAKLSFASRQKEYNQVTPASLMPYPGPWISHELDDRVRRTSLARALFMREHRGYWRIWRRGREEAERYACDNAGMYLKFQSFWPSIMNALWNDAELASMLERS
ncbi:MAG: glycosyltransferase [Collinsella sp.]|nr:glycosyltransferase [Collinsella sp.]